MDRAVLEFMLEQLKPFKMRIAIVFVCMIFISIVGLLNPLLQRAIFDEGIMAGNLGIVVTYTLFIIGLFLVEQIFSFVQFVNYERINRRVPYNLLHKAVEHSVKLKVSYHKNNDFAKTINNVLSDIMHISQTLNGSLLQALVNVFKIIGGVVGLSLIDWRLTTFVLLIIPLELFIKRFIASKKSKNFEIP